MIHIMALLSLASSCGCFMLGLFVYHLNKAKSANKIFLLMCASISYLAFTNFMALQAEGLDVAYFWSKAGFLWPFSISFMVHFVLVFVEQRILKAKQLVIFLIYMPASIFSFFELTTNFITDGLIKTNWGYSYITPEKSFVVWASDIWLYTLAFIGMIFCANYYIKGTGLKRKQSKFVFIGMIIPFLIYLSLELFSIFLQAELPDFSVFSTSALCVFMGYGIWKYDLLTVNQVTMATNIINLMPDSLILINQKEEIISVNRSVVTLLGYAKDEIVGKKFDLFFSEKKIAKKVIEHLFAEEKINGFETKFMSKSNQQFDVSISAQLIRDQLGEIQGTIIIISDITEKKRMEKNLIQSEKLATIGKVTTMVGHDLRNPLQAIESGLYVLTREMSKNEVNNKTKTVIDSMSKSIEYADNIVENLRSFATTENTFRQEIDINAILEASLPLVNKPDNIKLVIETEKLPKIKVDKNMLKRVFVNLATNGMQAMAEKGGTITVATKKNGNFVEVSFQDTGSGISKESMKKLFSPFFTTKAKGMGIGLALSKKFVESNGGSIEVRSQEGKGSEFTIKFPYSN